MLASLSPDSSAARPVKPKLKSRPAVALLIIVLGLAGLALALIAAISFGAREIPFRVVWEALFAFNPELMDHQIIQEIRLPRVLAAAIVGASFAVSGAVMQGMTRNPLADSGLL